MSPPHPPSWYVSRPLGCAQSGGLWQSESTGSVTILLQAHCARMLAGGWGAARSLDMDTIYQRHLDAAEKARAEGLEVFDEFEEWHMIQVWRCECHCTTVNNVMCGFSPDICHKLCASACSAHACVLRTSVLCRSITASPLVSMTQPPLPLLLGAQHLRRRWEQWRG